MSASSGRHLYLVMEVDLHSIEWRFLCALDGRGFSNEVKLYRERLVRYGRACV